MKEIGAQSLSISAFQSEESVQCVLNECNDGSLFTALQSIVNDDNIRALSDRAC